jgi:type VI protein secretion system component Hcp
MPFYAYIKIPGVENTESTDLYYGKDWVPIRSYDLSNEENEGITAKSRSAPDDGARKGNKKTRSQVRDMIWRHENAEHELQFVAGGSEMFGDLFSNAWQEALDVAQAEESEIAGTSTVTITKLMDTVTPKLHQFCMECAHGEDRGAFLKGNVELHICREVEKNGEPEPQLFMAYLLENCGIASMNINASDNANLSETVKISFQKITTSTNFDGTGWLSKSWDMVRGEEASTNWKPARPSKSSQK